MSATAPNRRPTSPAKPTLAQVRVLARQLSPASRHKLLTELQAAEMAEEVQEVTAISLAIQADTRARGLSRITDADIARELKVARQQRAA